MKWINSGSKIGFLSGVLFCLIVLTVVYLGQTIHAASDPQAKMPEMPMGEIPREFGELKAVHPIGEKGEALFWFENKKGTIRMIDSTIFGSAKVWKRN